MSRRFKNIIIIVLLVLVTSSFAGCKVFQAPDIGLSTSDTIGMTKKIVDDVEKLAGSDQFKITVLDANGNYDTQEIHIQSLIEQGVNVLLICPVDDDEILRSVKAANENNIPVVVFERPIDDPNVAFFARNCWSDGQSKRIGCKPWIS